MIDEASVGEIMGIINLIRCRERIKDCDVLQTVRVWKGYENLVRIASKGLLKQGSIMMRYKLLRGTSNPVLA